LDAKHIKVRDHGRVVSKALVIAYAVHETGVREVIGLDVGEVESGSFWTEFLRGLNKRGLQRRARPGRASQFNRVSVSRVPAANSRRRRSASVRGSTALGCEQVQPRHRRPAQPDRRLCSAGNSSGARCQREAALRRWQTGGRSIRFATDEPRQFGSEIPRGCLVPAERKRRPAAGRRRDRRSWFLRTKEERRASSLTH
jgi:hypothetical protein